jgi:MinD-like ATPase involved in chromosome partitioning or flagellar assembly
MLPASVPLPLVRLLQVPFEPSVVSACDQGVPVVVGQPESATAQAYKSIAHQLAQQLAQRGGQQQAGPKIVVQP